MLSRTYFLAAQGRAVEIETLRFIEASQERLSSSKALIPPSDAADRRVISRNAADSTRQRQLANIDANEHGSAGGDR
jgi:hypothetical protein